RPLTTPVRAAFLTRPPRTASISVTGMYGERATPGSAFLVEFDGPVDTPSLRGAIRLEPAITGTLERLDPTVDSWLFTPAEPLEPDTLYRVSLSGRLLDADGAPLAEYPVIEVRTVPVPRVVRFRPVDKATSVGRDQTLSVRFSEPMDRDTTSAAFSATVGGEPIAGTVSFAEDDTVLVFDPKADFD